MIKHARSFSVLIILSTLASTAFAVTTVTFQDKFFARSTPDFDARDTRNAIGTIAPEDKAILIGQERTRYGNWGLKVQLTEGPRKGKSFWVYHHNAGPNITLMKDGQRITPDGKVLTAPPRVSLPIVSSAPSADSRDQKYDDRAEAKPCTTCSTNAATPFSAESIAQVKETLASTYPSAFKGALKTMAVMYQSCSALEKDPYPMNEAQSIDKYLKYERFVSSLGHRYNVRTLPKNKLASVVNTHYYLKDLKGPENSQCQDMRTRPPLYTYGGKRQVSKTEINLLIKQPTSGADFSGIDCSAFVSTALTASGLRIKPGQPILENRATSTQLANFTSKNSCFAQPGFTSENTILPGDIIAYSGHTFMIDTVGKDPFGLDKMKARGVSMSKASDCDRLPSDADKLFDFRLIQSTGDGSLAISRTEASVYLRRSGLKNLMDSLLNQACLAKVSGNKVAVKYSNKANLLRHRGGEVPGCLIPKEQIPRMTGEACVAACT